MTRPTPISVKVLAFLRHPLKPEKRRQFRRARNASSQPRVDPNDYQDWVRRYDTITVEDRHAMGVSLKSLAYQPLISVVMPVYDPHEGHFRQAIDSVRDQVYPNWELCIADDASPTEATRAIIADYAAMDPRIKGVRRAENGGISAASNSALDLAQGEFVALLDHDDLLPNQALYEVIVELNAHPQADIIYTDEDKIDEDGRRFGAYFKPDWNPELLLSQNFMNQLSVYRRSLVNAVKGFRIGFEGSQDYDLALRCVAVSSADKIRHIPAVLYHWRRTARASEFSQIQLERCIASAQRAKADYLSSIGEAGDVLRNPKSDHSDRIIRPIPVPAPLVSLIVPTRNRADLLRPCLDGLMNRTSYQPLEIIIIDHQSDDPETLELLDQVVRDPRVRVMPYTGAFNYSAMNNRAVESASGDVVCLLNNDIDVVTPDWLTEMVAHAVRPQNGAVGAKLIYPSGRIQHAGVRLGMGGLAGHIFCHSERESLGHFGRLHLVSNVSAVTAACLVVRKALYQDVGGLNETDLLVAFNDVDFCLKLRAKNYFNVWTPFAVLVHHESPSRGPDTTAETKPRFTKECNWMLETWGDVLQQDPYFNPNLSLDTHNFDLAFPPRRVKPWQHHFVDSRMTRAE
jgi:glycosyltransferase involved in cell wall biosynthesis